MDYSTILNEITLIPTNEMSLEEKLNAIMRLVLVLGIIVALIFNDIRYILFIIIIIICVLIIYNYQSNKNYLKEKFLDDNGIDIIDNKYCTKPTVENPFMNPNVLEKNNYGACSISNPKIKKEIQKNFYSRIYRDSDDIYGKIVSERNFYTVPSTTIPNDRETYINWLYNRGKSCKENNEEQCYKNIL